MHEGGDEEDVLPLFPSLAANKHKTGIFSFYVSKLTSFVLYIYKCIGGCLRLSVMSLFEQDVLTLFLVMAPTIRGHTIPDRVPTPLEMPIRMLA